MISFELFDKKMNKKINQSLKMQLIGLIWLNWYSSLITLIQIEFSLHQDYFNMIMNVSYILNQIMTVYYVNLLFSQVSYTKEDLKFQYISLRSTVFCVLFIADIALMLLFNNVCFVSYDNYEVLFANFSLFSNVIRLSIVIYSKLITKDLEIKFG